MPQPAIISQLNGIKKHYQRLEELNKEAAKERAAILLLVEELINTCGGRCPYVEEEKVASQVA